MISQRDVGRLVGRLASLSHAFPEIAPNLAGGYAIAAARLRRCSHVCRAGRVGVGVVSSCGGSQQFRVRVEQHA